MKNDCSYVSRKKILGLSLLELMIGMVIGLVILGAGLKVMGDSVRLSKVTTVLERMRNDAQVSLQDIRSSVKAAGVPPFCMNKFVRGGDYVANDTNWGSVTASQIINAGFSFVRQNGVQYFQGVNNNANASYALNDSASNHFAAFDPEPGVWGFDYQGSGSWLPRLETSGMYNQYWRGQVLLQQNWQTIPVPTSDVLIVKFYDYVPGAFVYVNDANNALINNISLGMAANYTPAGVNPFGGVILPSNRYSTTANGENNGILTGVNAARFTLMRYDNCLPSSEDSFLFLSQIQPSTTTPNVHNILPSYAAGAGVAPGFFVDNALTNPNIAAIAKQFSVSFLKTVFYFVADDPMNNNIPTLFKGTVMQDIQIGYLPFIGPGAMQVYLESLATNVQSFEILYNDPQGSDGALNWMSADDGVFFTNVNGVKVGLVLGADPNSISATVQTGELTLFPSVPAESISVAPYTPNGGPQRYQRKFETTIAIDNAL